MNLIGDIGNTETKICLFDYKKKLIMKRTLNTNDLKLSRLNFIIPYKKKINQAIFSSVVPSTFKLLKKFFLKRLQLKIKELKQFNLKKKLKIEVNMREIGSDRIANALGVIDYKRNFIVLDFGTATTFDVVIKDRYKGGVIAPGVNLSLKTLTSKATLIPTIKLSKVKSIIGKSTQNAVRAGFYWGYQGLIENIIKMIEKDTKKKYQIIFTGGLSYLFKDTVGKKLKIDKDLTIKGLLKLI